MLNLQNCCSDEHLSTVPWSFLCPLLLSFCLQIAHRKVKNLQSGVDKLVRKARISYIMQSQLLA